MEHVDSLLRPELTGLDLVHEGTGESCDATLTVRPGHVHDCTRPRGHKGQHYSFNAEGSYEIIWPIARAPWTNPLVLEARVVACEFWFKSANALMHLSESSVGRAHRVNRWADH